MIDVGSAVGYLLLDTSQFKKGFNSALNDLKTFTDKTTTTSDKIKALSSAFTDTGKNMTKYLTLPLTGAGAAIMTVGDEFEAQMSRVQAIAGATGEELEQLTDLAIDLGAETSFSASQVAEAMENLASAGFTTAEIMEAIPGLLDLAASSGADLATASDIAASSIRGFGLEASDAGHVADVLAEAAARTNAQVEDMGDAMKYVAPVASAMGQSLEETAAAIGIMSDAGIKGSQAGTSLRGALSRLAKPTEEMEKKMQALGLSFYDAEGNMVPLNEIVEQLQSSFEGLTQEQQNNALVTLFGQESLSGMLALIQRGPDELRALTEGFENADGAAKEMADVMLDNTSGAIEELTGSIETLAIKFQQVMAPVITDIVKGLTDFVNTLSSADENVLKVVAAIAGIAAVLGPVLIIVGQIINAITAVSGAISTVIGFIPAVVTAITTLINPFTLVVGAILAFALAWETNLFGIRDKVTEFVEWVQSALQEFAEWLKSYITEKISTIIEWFSQLPEKVSEIFQSMITTVSDFVTQLYNSFVSGIQNAVQTVLSFWDNLPYRIGYALGYALGTISNWAEEVYTFITVRIPEIIDEIVRWFEALPSRVAQWLQATLDTITTWATDTYEYIIDSINRIQQSLVEWATQLYDSAVMWFEETKQAVVDWGNGVYNNVVSILTNFINAVRTWLSKLPSEFEKWLNDVIDYLFSLPSKFLQLGEDIMNGFFDGVKNIGDQILGWFEGIVDSIQDFLQGIWDGISDAKDAMDEAESMGSGKSHAAGLDYVPYNGYRALLHEGEAVLTKEENKNRNKTSGNTFVFNSPEPIDEVRAAQLFKKTQKELAKGL